MDVNTTNKECDCKGTIFKCLKSNYLYNNVITEKTEFRLMKRMSCNHCGDDRCTGYGWSMESISYSVDPCIDKVFVNSEKCEHEHFYQAIPCGDGWHGDDEEEWKLVEVLK